MNTYALYTAEAWSNSGEPLSFHPTEAAAWSRAVELVDAGPIKPVFGRWSHAYADYRVVCQIQTEVK